MRRRPAALALCVLALSLAAASQPLYKWTDATGRVQYSDTPPKDFKGEVTRIERDVAPTPVPVAPPLTVPAKPAPDKAAPPAVVSDPAKTRREARARLGAGVEAARARLDAARKALDEAGHPGDDERQVVQQRFAKGTRPATARSNCRNIAGPDGKKTLTCPVIVPNDAYYGRLSKLEEEVKRAEEALETAERAYRQGVD